MEIILVNRRQAAVYGGADFRTLVAGQYLCEWVTNEFALQVILKQIILIIDSLSHINRFHFIQMQ